MARSNLQTEFITGVAIAASIYVLLKGGIGNAVSALTAGAVSTAGDVAVGVATGAVTGASDVIGIPSPSQTTTDPAVARWIIDYPTGGVLKASQWASASAFAQALTLPSGSGVPPPAGSAVAAAFPPDGLTIDLGTSTGTSSGW